MEKIYYYTVRRVLGMLAVPIMRATGFRFSKAYRHADEGWKRWVYLAVDVLNANRWAGFGWIRINADLTDRIEEILSGETAVLDPEDARSLAEVVTAELRFGS